MPKVVVTGGAGFLGSHVAKEKLAQGNEVVIVDNFSSGFVENLSDLGVKQKCVVGDLRDYEFAKRAVAGADVVYHFAAEVGSVQYLHGTADRELDALEANLVIDANVFKACRENRVGCIMYASSVSVYPFERQLGGSAVFKEREAMERVSPEGGYGWSKFLGEVQLNMMAGTSVGIARIFHAYGENIYLKPNRSQVIASLMYRTIRNSGEDLVVWGDGTQKRCFVFIDDALVALQRIEKYVMQNENLAVNLGSQEENSVKELAEQIIQISGKKIEIRFDTSKPTGAMSRTPDLEKIKGKIGWEPRTSFRDGLRRTYAWAEKRLSSKEWQ
jgi:nucleoside-diphosphate-sugar epimerase